MYTYEDLSRLGIGCVIFVMLGRVIISGEPDYFNQSNRGGLGTKLAPGKQKIWHNFGIVTKYL